MRRGHGLTILLLLLVALAAGCGGEPEEREELRIGLLAPLSLHERYNTHRFLLERLRLLNAKGGLELGGRKVPVKLFIEDSGLRLENTLSAMGRLVRQNNIAALIGPYYSREAIPVGAAMEAFRLPMLTPTASNPLVTRERRYCFRLCQLDADQARMLAQHAYESMGLRRVAVLYDETDSYATGMAETFRQAFGQRQGAAVLAEPYAPDQTGVLPQLERIRASGAQALLLPNINRDLSGLLQQARAAGFAGVFLGGDSWDTDQGFHALPEAQGSLYTTDYTPATADRKLLESAQAMAATLGATLDKDAALTLDSLDFILAAARRAGSTEPEALRRAMAELKGFEGLSGPVSFSAEDGGGDPERSGYLMCIVGGESRLVARSGVARRRVQP